MTEITSKELREKIRGRYVEEDGCWVWTGTASGNGYGVITIRGTRYLVRRLVYALLSRKSNEGLEDKIIKSTCDNPACINPAHLVKGDKNKSDRASYDWEGMFGKKGKSKLLVRGEDYECTDASMAQQIRNAAQRLRLSISIRKEEDGLMIHNWGKK